jgi:hypothetical protein
MGLNPFGEEEDKVMPISGLPAGGMSLGVNPIQAAPQMMAPMGSGVPEDPMARARQIYEETIGGARQGIDPRIEAILARREQRLAEQEGQIRERPSLGETLVNIGTSMARTQSPFFGTALSEGLAANMQAQRAMRAEALRQRAAIEGTRDEIGMERIRQEGAGQREAIERLNTVFNIANTIGGIEGRRLENEAKTIANRFAPQEAVARLDGLIADATTKGAKAKYAEESERADLGYKRAQTASALASADRARREPSERSREMTANQAYNAEQNFLKADQDMREALEEYRLNYEEADGGSPGGSKRIDQTKFAKYKAALDRRERMREVYEKTFGRPPASSGRMVLPDGTPAMTRPVQPVGGSGRPVSSAPPVSSQGWSASRL